MSFFRRHEDATGGSRGAGWECARRGSMGAVAVVVKMVGRLSFRGSVAAAGSVAEGQYGQIAPTAPEGARAGHAVVLGAKMTAEAADPQDRLTHRRRRLISCGGLFVKARPQGAPLVLVEHARAGSIGFTATGLYSAMALANRSAVSKRKSSIRQPLLRTR